MKLGVASILTCAGSLLFLGVAEAADVYSPVAPEAEQVVTESGWTFSVAPYFWAAGLSGDVASFGPPEVHIDASFSDIFDHLDFGAMSIAEARYDRYSIFGDIMYPKISGAAGTPRGVLASTVEVSSETFSGLIGAGYSILEGSSGHLDIVGGVKVWSADTDVVFRGGILDGCREATEQRGWTPWRACVEITRSLPRFI